MYFFAKDEACSLPAESGMCMAYMPKFFFNTTSGQCDTFIYGGCQGNKNNFESKEECEQACECDD